MHVVLQTEQGTFKHLQGLVFFHFSSTL